MLIGHTGKSELNLKCKEMSRDVARLIHELAYNREVDLKKYYIDFIKNDNNKTRIERAIKQAIERNCSQTQLCINDYIDFGLFNVATTITQEYYNHLDENERMYCTKYAYSIVIVRDTQLKLRDLIKNVIIPFDLSWCIEYDYEKNSYNKVVVDWSHWKK